MKRSRVEYGKPIPVRLPKEVLQRVDEISKRIGEPRSTVMRIAMRLGLDGLAKAVEVEPPKLSTLVNPPSSASADTESKLIEELDRDMAREKASRASGVPRPKGKQ